ncbi:DUF4430 domain-containing protein [Cohnella candidum]|uniref:DUF4430 domain-containing protein n=1 Tax=Cohnella candidum TaxID=2674991 RepID=A0A3G3K3Q2_9BACL|nr:DUF4430 domain-containing protein [Cohnella candidum]AYQ74667.1 DUF4430 domain-containing protein [Cohnella candidum]
MLSLSWRRAAVTAMLAAAILTAAACGTAEKPQPNEASSASAAASPPAGQVSPTQPASPPASPAASSTEPSTEPSAVPQPKATTESPPATTPSIRERVDDPPASASSPAAPSPSTPAKPAEPSPPAKDAGKETAQTVTISVVGNAEWGSVLDPQQVKLQKNDTVADLLIRTLKAHKLAYDTSGSGAMFYVAGIDGLFEFDDGPTSGWKYKVNGKVLDVGAGSYKPKPGDRVEWFYTSSDKQAEESKEQAP